MQKTIVITLLSVAGVLVVGSGSTDKEKKKQAAKVSAATTDVSVSAVQLAAEYKANEVAADGTYKGKIIEVTGAVDKIGKDILDQPYVSLSGGKGDLFGVQCVFAKHDLSKLSKLKKGQRVTAKCKGAGKMVSVSLKHCSLK